LYNPIQEVLVAIEAIIRPSAILSAGAAAAILRALDLDDVAYGGRWSASSGLWHRYDRPWDGPSGSRGNSQLAGSIAVVYESPVRNQITIYKVTITDAGHRMGMTVDSLCDEALGHAYLTLASCPRATLSAPPAADPFRVRARPAVRAPLVSF
jgi:hypothetical protein